MRRSAGSADAPAILVDGEPAAAVAADDRGFNYGDGVFETIAVRDGRPLAWAAHLARLARGCTALGFAPPAEAILSAEAAALAAAQPRAVLKIVVTRGGGGRGYRPLPAAAARRVLSLHPWPVAAAAPAAGALVWICAHRLAEQPALAGLKHLNRLDQVLASREWPGEAYFEGLTTNAAGQLISGTRSNLFLVRDGRVWTPSLTRCGVHGVVRAAVLRWCAETGVEVRETALWPLDLARADEAFLSSSIMGLCALRGVRELPTLALRPGPLTARAAAALRAADVIA